MQSKQSQQWTRHVHTSGQCTGNWTNSFNSEEPFLATGLIHVARWHCFALNTSRSHSLLECVGIVQSAVMWTVINSTWLHVKENWGVFSCCKLFSCFNLDLKKVRNAWKTLFSTWEIFFTLKELFFVHILVPLEEFLWNKCAYLIAYA